MSNERPDFDIELKPETTEIDTPLTEGVEDRAAASETETTPVQEALASIKERDTIDVYARRLNGTSVLGTKSITGVGAPATILTLMASSSVHTGGIIAGASAAAAGTAVAAGVYGIQRVTEKRRAEKAESAQQVVRDSLEEPVDIISNKKEGLTVRWYGADEQYGNQDDPSIPGRFEKVVKFAEENDVAKIVTSANLATVEGEIDENIKATTTREILKDTKKQPIDDLKADKKLAELTTVQAREILDRLKTENLVTKTEAIADWLASVRPNHPVRPLLEEWKRLGKPQELLKRVIEPTVHAGLVLHFNGSGDRLPEAMRIGNNRVKAESTAAVEPGRVSYANTPKQRFSGQEQTVTELVPFSSIVHSDMNEFVENLLEQRGKPVEPIQPWKLELALYHLLTTGDQSEAVGQARHNKDASKYETETLFQRILKEQPKTNPLKPWLPKRGGVDKLDQTIEYKRLHRNWFKKAGAAALAFGLGAGMGLAWGSATEKAYEATDCRILYLDGDDKNCSPTDKFYAVLANANSFVTDGSATWEEKVITKAYDLGIITPENYENILDIENPTPNQPQDKSRVGDSEQGPTDGILWSLESINNASTKGYWYTGVQSNIFLESMDKETGLAPYEGLTMSYRDTSYTNSLFTSGELPQFFSGSDVEQMRELDIPTAPDSTDKELIKVSGEMPLASGVSLEELLPSEETKDWNSLVLPVIADGDIVAAKITLIDTRTGEIIEGTDSKIIQKNDGTFNILADGPNSHVQLRIDYWVDPNATTDTMLQATEPMTVNTIGQSYPDNLSELLSPEDVTEILGLLGLPPNATASQIAEAVRASDTYSYTPYQDANVSGTIDSSNANIPSGEMLVNIAKEAIDLDSSNCNVAFTIGLIASRGIDDDFINGGAGYLEDGNGLLTQSELHKWGITNEGEIIDGTPSGNVETPPIAEVEFASNRETLKLTSQLAGGLLAMFISAAASRRYWPKAEEIILKHQSKVAAKWLEEPKRAPELNQAAAALRHLVFAPSESRLPELLPTTHPQPIANQMSNLPQLTRKQINNIFRERAANNQPVSPNTQRTIRQATAKYRTAGRTKR